MNVYTYYMPVLHLWSEESQRRLIEVWRRSWAKQGWNPIVLSEGDAAQHPRYAEFKKKFWELPTEYGHDYEGACFMRWVATANCGGGMMTDYDVINYNFAPREPKPDKMVIFSEPDTALFMGAIHAPKALFEQMCQNFLDWQPDQRDWNAHANLFHCSDLTYLQQVMLFKNRPALPWLVKEPGCSEYPNMGGSMVHFGYHLIENGFKPKHAWIEKLRPL
jgi:hypothetical protein